MSEANESLGNDQQTESVPERGEEQMAAMYVAFTHISKYWKRENAYSASFITTISGFSAVNCSGGFVSISPLRGFVPTFALKLPLSS